ncbi:MAG: MFS transporter [Polaromonas sp.]|nr:MFS transporter [Polaromonas sp.]
MTHPRPTLSAPPDTAWQGFWVAAVLSLSAAVSLGITRFAYGLLLPPMREDLGWSYTLAGAMNTANALGYLLGALTAPWLMRRFPVPRVLVGGAALASVFMAASGFLVEAWPLLAQRLLAGVTSAWVFVAGGLLAARLGTWHPQRSGLLLGVVYGGVGWGIVLSAWVVPQVLGSHAGQAHAWAWAWWWLALACGLVTVALLWPARFFMEKELSGQSVPEKFASKSGNRSPSAAGTPPPRLGRLAFSLAGYACFGLGYIGYMTFVIALLREQGAASDDITVFYSLLGVAVVLSARLWAGLLDKAQGGGALALLNALLGVATVLPALFTAWPLMLLSGLMFGGVFLSVVASTTALVRHNLPTAQWPAGISAFTIVFAVGQIFGPSLVGWIADGPGGLTQGLLWSAIALWVGAGLAWRQQPLPR